MRKILAIVLVMTMIATASACSCNGNSDNQKTDAPTNSTGGSQQSGNEDHADTPAEKKNEAGSAKLTGELIPVPNNRDDMPELRGVSFYGNRVGSVEFNSKEPSTTGIRCIFELNEYFLCIPDTDQINGIKIYILEHREDQKSYETADYGDQMPGFVNTMALNYNADEKEWIGEIYLHPEEVNPGYYDFVFTYEGTPFAKLFTRFYAEGELEGKSDADLEKLMKE